MQKWSYKTLMISDTLIIALDKRTILINTFLFWGFMLGRGDGVGWGGGGGFTVHSTLLRSCLSIHLTKLTRTFPGQASPLNGWP